MLGALLLLAAVPGVAAESPRPTIGYLPPEALADDSLRGALAAPPGRWRPLHPDSANLGTGRRTFWFRIEVPEDARRPGWYLVARQARALAIDAFFVDAQGRVLARRQGGRLGPDARTAMVTGHTAMPLPASGSDVERVYLRARFHGAMRMPVRFAPREQLATASLAHVVTHGVILGALGIMFAFNLVLALVLRRRVYGFYLAHVLGLAAWFAVETGIAQFFLWPDRQWLDLLASRVTLALSVILSLAFVQEFLDLRRQAPAWARLLSAAGVVTVATLAWPGPLGWAGGMNGLLAAGVLACVSILGLGIRLWRRGYRPAQWFLPAWGAYLAGASVSASVAAGWLPAYPVLVHGQHIGAVLEVTLLAVALAARIRYADRARREAQRRAERAETARAQDLARERERLLRDLHDGAGHKLVTLVRWAESANLARAPLVASLRDILVELRMTVHGLNTRASSFGIVMGKLRQQLEPRLAESGVELEWDLSPRLASTPSEPWRLLEFVRIAQEAITNALRHGNATRVRVSAGIAEAGESPLIELEIGDDGAGFDAEQQDEGIGLGSIRGRAARLGGTAEIHSARRQGTRVVIRVPATQEETAPAGGDELARETA